RGRSGRDKDSQLAHPDRDRLLLRSIAELREDFLHSQKGAQMRPDRVLHRPSATARQTRGVLPASVASAPRGSLAVASQCANDQPGGDSWMSNAQTLHGIRRSKLVSSSMFALTFEEVPARPSA